MSNEQPKRQRCVIHKDIIQDIASAIRQKENSDNKYTPVQMKNAILNLPTGSITAQDEGKVVQNGSLVNQTSLSITQNNTYDTTTKN